MPLEDAKGRQFQLLQGKLFVATRIETLIAIGEHFPLGVTSWQKFDSRVSFPRLVFGKQLLPPALGHLQLAQSGGAEQRAVLLLYRLHCVHPTVLNLLGIPVFPYRRCR